MRKPRQWLGLYLTLYIQYIGMNLLNFKLYFLLFDGFRWFGGLTYDFAE
jgi:hypothetical protein